MLVSGAPNPEGAAALMYGNRYDELDGVNKIPVDDVDAYFEETGIPYEFDMEVKAIKNRESTTSVLFTWPMFEMGQFFGDIWFRPFLGEPWSTIAEEISPKVDDVLDGIMNS